ncbi:MAG: phosphotransferase enzyme family protein [Thermomicrobiales bacterium]
MLEKPDVPDEKLISCLRDHYGLHVTQVAFLPLGNDVNTAVYRVVADDGTPYFLKLRSGAFDETTVTIPRFLHSQGIAQIIAPIATAAGRLWMRMDAFAMILFPFVVGKNGVAAPLSERQWTDLGTALRRIHMAAVPPALKRRIPHEQYAPYWRDLVRTFQARAEENAFTDPIAAALAAFLRDRRDEISHLIERADALGAVLRAQLPDMVLCHADIHAANVLIDANGALYIVDWDTLIVAPKERDLMFIGGGVASVWNSARAEALFYRGYGRTEINPVALAYYRYERIVEDIAAYCEELLLTDEGGADRERGLRSVIGQFLPNRVVAIAYASDPLFNQSAMNP